jgi:hypothetical protein
LEVRCVTGSTEVPTWVECGVTEADLVGLRAAAPSAGRLVEEVARGDRPAGIEALFHLKNEICHQGMAISGSTPVVLPFLIALLPCRALAVRVEVFQLIRRVAQASTAWRRAARDAGSKYADNYRESVEWEVAVDRIFVESRSQFEALRNDSDAAIRQLAEEMTARTQ